MNCPYLDCDCDRIPTGNVRCPECERCLNICGKCAFPNRVFASHCRECGNAFPESHTDWPSFKGGPQRLGLSRAVPDRRISELGAEDMGTLQLPDRCKSLLIHDRHLFAFSQSGEVRLADISRSPVREIASFHAGGNIHAMPAIKGGSLYLATEKSIQAYSLGNLSVPKSSPKPRWEARPDGIPIRELLALRNRLFFTLAHPERHHEIRVMEEVASSHPKASEKLCGGPRLSSLAGHCTEKIKKVYFLSENREGMRLHLLDLSGNSEPDPVSLPVKGAPSEFRERVPIAVIGARIFAVFKEEETLCRLDANTGEVDRRFCKNVREFVMAGINEPVATTSKGLLFQRINKKVELGDDQGVRGTPLILKDCAVVAGMRDGSVHLYDLHNPALPLIWNVSEHSDEPITVLAAWGNIVAAGNEKGRVKVCRLV